MAIEDAYPLADYLPTEPDSGKSEYMKDLWKLFEVNYQPGMYGFSYIALHMLFMAYVYFALCKVRLEHKEKIRVALDFTINKPDVRKQLLPTEEEEELRPFYFGNFGLLPESEVFRLFEFAGLDPSLLVDLRKQVQRRNDIAHVRGAINLSTEQELDREIHQYINLAEKIHGLIKPIIVRQYEIFLIESQDAETRFGSADDSEQVKEYWIRRNDLSKKEINACRQFRFSSLSDRPGYAVIQNLASILHEFYKSLDDEE